MKTGALRQEIGETHACGATESSEPPLLVVREASGVTASASCESPCGVSSRREVSLEFAVWWRQRGEFHTPISRVEAGSGHCFIVDQAARDLSVDAMRPGRAPRCRFSVPGLRRITFGGGPRCARRSAHCFRRIYRCARKRRARQQMADRRLTGRAPQPLNPPANMSERRATAA